MAKYNIGGYIFSDEESAKKAAKELKAVEYILAQIKTADETEVLQIYKKLINQRLFSTEIGMGFLSQLYQNLITVESFNSNDIPKVYSLDGDEPSSDNQVIDNSTQEKEPIKKETSNGQEASSKKSKNKEVKKEKTKKESKADADSCKQQIKRLKIINTILIIISATLLLCVLGMFYISSTINSPNIMNYKETITDEYSQWKQELEEKEAELKERERALEERESGQ